MSSTLSAGAFACGVAAHLLIFKQDEHHLYPVQWLQAFLVTFGAMAFAQKHLLDSPIRYAIVWSFSICVLFLAGLFSSLATYRLMLNPLNSIPGHYFARLTRFDMTFRVLKQDSHRQLNRLHGRYGRFVRVGPNDISVTDPEAVQIVHGTQTKFTKAPWYDCEYPNSSLQSTRSKKFHDLKRRAWAPAFADKALRGYEERISVYNDLLVQQIRKRLGKPLDMSKWFNHYSFDVMGDLGFGAPFDMLVSGKEHWVIKTLQDGMGMYGAVLSTWIFRIIIAIPGLTAGYMKFISFCGQQIESRAQQHGKKQVQDIAHYLIEEYNKSEDKGVAAGQLHADSRLIIVAGSDTTSATLTHLFYHLARDGDLVERLREEIESKLQGGRLTHLKIQDTSFLNGCINETLRLNPPVPSGLFRQAPKEGVMIGKRFIPGNTVIQIPTFVMGHDNEIYPSAEEFIPERWYSRPELIKHKDAFHPFSSGTYGCIGKNLALMEIRLLTAQLVMLFDVAFALGETGRILLEESKDHFTMELAPLELVFTERK